MALQFNFEINGNMQNQDNQKRNTSVNKYLQIEGNQDDPRLFLDLRFLKRFNANNQFEKVMQKLQELILILTLSTLGCPCLNPMKVTYLYPPDINCMVATADAQSSLNSYFYRQKCYEHLGLSRLPDYVESAVVISCVQDPNGILLLDIILCCQITPQVMPILTTLSCPQSSKAYVGNLSYQNTCPFAIAEAENDYTNFKFRQACKIKYDLDDLPIQVYDIGVTSCFDANLNPSNFFSGIMIQVDVCCFQQCQMVSLNEIFLSGLSQCNQENFQNPPLYDELVYICKSRFNIAAQSVSNIKMPNCINWRNGIKFDIQFCC